MKNILYFLSLFFILSVTKNHAQNTFWYHDDYYEFIDARQISYDGGLILQHTKKASQVYKTISKYDRNAQSLWSFDLAPDSLHCNGYYEFADGKVLLILQDEGIINSFIPGSMYTLVLMMLDPSGNKLWEKVYWDPEDPWRFWQATLGNIILLEPENPNTDFLICARNSVGWDDPNNPYSYYRKNGDYYREFPGIERLNIHGNSVWKKRIDANHFNNASSNIVLSKDSQSVFITASTPNLHEPPDSSKWSVGKLVEKIDLYGNTIWQKIISVPITDSTYGHTISLATSLVELNNGDLLSVLAVQGIQKGYFSKHIPTIIRLDSLGNMLNYKVLDTLNTVGYVNFQEHNNRFFLMRNAQHRDTVIHEPFYDIGFHDCRLDEIDTAGTILNSFVSHRKGPYVLNMLFDKEGHILLAPRTWWEIPLNPFVAIHKLDIDSFSPIPWDSNYYTYDSLQTQNWNGNYYTLDIYSKLDSIYKNSWLDIPHIETKSLALSISPNPVVETFIIKGDFDMLDQDYYHLELFSSKGQVVYFEKKTYDKLYEPIDISHLPTGYYFLKIEYPKSKKKWSAKIVKR